MTDAFRVTWSKRVCLDASHRNSLTEKAWEDAVQGLGKSVSIRMKTIYTTYANQRTYKLCIACL